MTVRTHVFTRLDGSQVLLCVYPDRLTVADRPTPTGIWGPPIPEDDYYRATEPRNVEEIAALVADEFGEVL